MPLSKKRLAGVAVSTGLFAMFGLWVGTFVGAFVGVSLGEPVDALATGPTPVPLSELLAPLGVTSDDVGLPGDATVWLPGIPVTVEVLGVRLSVSGLSLANVSIGGGALLGLFVGLYYLADIAYEEFKDAAGDGSSSSE